MSNSPHNFSNQSSPAQDLSDVPLDLSLKFDPPIDGDAAYSMDPRGLPNPQPHPIPQRNPQGYGYPTPGFDDRYMGQGTSQQQFHASWNPSYHLHQAPGRSQSVEVQYANDTYCHQPVMDSMGYPQVGQFVQGSSQQMHQEVYSHPQHVITASGPSTSSDYDRPPTMKRRNSGSSQHQDYENTTSEEPQRKKKTSQISSESMRTGEEEIRNVDETLTAKEVESRLDCPIVYNPNEAKTTLEDILKEYNNWKEITTMNQDIFINFITKSPNARFLKSANRWQKMTDAEMKPWTRMHNWFQFNEEKKSKCIRLIIDKELIKYKKSSNTGKKKNIIQILEEYTKSNDFTHRGQDLIYESGKESISFSPREEEMLKRIGNVKRLPSILMMTKIAKDTGIRFSYIRDYFKRNLTN